MGLEWYHWTLIALASFAAACAWNLPRAVIWIGLGVLSYVSSAWWHNAGLPYGAFYGLCTNLVVCLALWAWAKYRWEMRVWNFFHLMIVIDILYLSGAIQSKLMFAESLEVVNAAALLFIAATGIIDRAGHGIFSGLFGRSRAWGLNHALFAKRKDPPGWKVP